MRTSSGLLGVLVLSVGFVVASDKENVMKIRTNVNRTSLFAPQLDRVLNASKGNPRCPKKLIIKTSIMFKLICTFLSLFLNVSRFNELSGL